MLIKKHASVLLVWAIIIYYCSVKLEDKTTQKNLVILTTTDVDLRISVQLTCTGILKCLLHVIKLLLWPLASALICIHKDSVMVERLNILSTY